MIAAVVVGIIALLVAGVVVVRALEWLGVDPEPDEWDRTSWSEWQNRHRW